MKAYCKFCLQTTEVVPIAITTGLFNLARCNSCGKIGHFVSPTMTMDGILEESQEVKVVLEQINRLFST